MKYCLFMILSVISSVCLAQHKDIVWAQVDGQSLTMDIYKPSTAKKTYPVIIIYHGGGWLLYDKSIMSNTAEYLVKHGEYIVCNVNYRLLDKVNMNQIIGDALGALAWVKFNISNYGGNPEEVVVMGDSAGGLLAAMVTNSSNQLRSGNFTSGHLLFKPTWLPKNMTAEQLAKSDKLKVQATILAYAGTDLYEACKYGMETKDNFFWSAAKVRPRGIFGDSIHVNDHPDYYKAVSPMHTIPLSSTRKLAPQLYLHGSKDNIVLPEWAKAYVKALKDAGQPVEYWEYANEPHAFLNTNEDLDTKFERDAPAALDKTIDFLNKIFYR